MYRDSRNHELVPQVTQTTGQPVPQKKKTVKYDTNIATFHPFFLYTAHRHGYDSESSLNQYLGNHLTSDSILQNLLES